MLRSGWFRLWVFITCFMAGGVIALGCYQMWGKPACYRYAFITPSPGHPTAEEVPVLNSIRQETNSRVYCGENQYSTLVTLEEWAKHGVVSQVTFQWQEPDGWSLSDFDRPDFLEGPEIRAQTLLDRVRENVQRARLRALRSLAIVAAAVSIALLVIGLGTAWVRRGFAK